MGQEHTLLGRTRDNLKGGRAFAGSVNHVRAASIRIIPLIPPGSADHLPDRVENRGIYD